jgi:hypothetical protein
MEAGSLVLGERGQDAGLGRVEHALDLKESPLSARGDAHDLATAFTRVTPAPARSPMPST